MQGDFFCFKVHIRVVKVVQIFGETPGRCLFPRMNTDIGGRRSQKCSIASLMCRGGATIAEFLFAFIAVMGIKSDRESYA